MAKLTGSSHAFNLPDDAVGQLSRRFDANLNKMSVLLGDTVIATVARTGASFLIEGIVGTAGEIIGSHTTNSLKSLSFVGTDANWLGLNLRPDRGDGVILGGDFNDDMFGAAVRPSDPYNSYIDPGAGNDMVFAGEAHDVIAASPDNDMIDGGAGINTMEFRLPAGVTGTLSHSIDTNGNQFVTLDDTVIIEIAALDDGSFLASGIPNTVGAIFGTEHMRNIDRIDVYLDEPGSSLSPATQLYVDVHMLDGHLVTHFTHDAGGGSIKGSTAGGMLDATRYFAASVGAEGVSVRPGSGNDLVIGTLGNDVFYSSAGSNALNGGPTDTSWLDYDTLCIVLNTGADGQVEHVIEDNGDITFLLNQQPIVHLQHLGGIDYLATPLNAALVSFGTERMVGIEQVRIVNAENDSIALDLVDLVDVVRLIGLPNGPILGD